jgi:hypothetical protein
MGLDQGQVSLGQGQRLGFKSADDADVADAKSRHSLGTTRCPAAPRDMINLAFDLLPCCARQEGRAGEDAEPDAFRFSVVPQDFAKQMAIAAGPLGCGSAHPRTLSKPR